MNASLQIARPTPIRQELGALLSILSLMIDDMRAVVLHVTSAHHSEGTTSVAREIATAAAMSGWCQVALVDAHKGEPMGTEARPDMRPDMRGAESHRASRSPDDARGTALQATRPGLLEYIERGEEPTLANARLGQSQVATGRLSTAGRSVVRLESVRGLYDFLRIKYMLVVVDAPPLLTTQDAALLVAAADATILVVEAERTRFADVTRARETVEQLGGSVLGVVLNKRRQHLPKIVRRFL